MTGLTNRFEALYLSPFCPEVPLFYLEFPILFTPELRFLFIAFLSAKPKSTLIAPLLSSAG